MSYPARGMGIEIAIGEKFVKSLFGHTPRGVWGLKWKSYSKKHRNESSYPARGMGIEILHLMYRLVNQKRHTPRGVWGLKSIDLIIEWCVEQVIPREGYGD